MSPVRNFNNKTKKLRISNGVTKNIIEYFVTLKGIYDKIIATGTNAKAYRFDEAINMSIDIINKQAASGGRLFFIGNGASAAISSHMATDFWKNGRIPAFCFNDSSLLTCISNDYGYKHVFEKPIEMFAKNKDILVAISSSGKSENVIRGVQMAQSKGCYIITLSGFDKDNPLRFLGEINFYVPVSSYGPVEIVHHSICHCMLDSIVCQRSKEKIKKACV